MDTETGRIYLTFYNLDDSAVEIRVTGAKGSTEVFLRELRAGAFTVRATVERSEEVEL